MKVGDAKVPISSAERAGGRGGGGMRIPALPPSRLLGARSGAVSPACIWPGQHDQFHLTEQMNTHSLSLPPFGK